MFCSKCGTQLSDDAIFCFKCGEKISTSSTTEIIHNPNQAVQTIGNMNNSEIREYLEHAKTLEVNRYTLNTTIDRLQSKINSLGIKNTFARPESQKGDFSKSFFIVLVLGVILSFIIAISTYTTQNNGIIYFIEPMIIGGIWISIPAALIGGAVSYFRKNGQRKKEYFKQIEDDNVRVEVEKKQILSLKEQQNELRTEVDKVEKLMEKLYSANIIYPKYRELVPIVTMWEYIDSGRCTELLGANGAYNLYESESRQDIIISNLTQALSMLAQIRDTQYALYEAIQESNDIAERVYRQSERLIASNKNIERNSEITSYNAKIAAQNSTISAYIDFCKF